MVKVGIEHVILITHIYQIGKFANYAAGSSITAWLYKILPTSLLPPAMDQIYCAWLVSADCICCCIIESNFKDCIRKFIFYKKNMRIY